MEPPNRDMPELINFLRTNGYQLVRVQYDPDRGASARAIFTKDANIVELDGNDVNDATINITIDFDRRLDYRHATINEEEEVVIYNDYNQARGQQFINQLINQTYDNPVVPQVPQGAPSNGGKRKGRKTKRRTRKNRRK
jgi:hypothetical protein